MAEPAYVLAPKAAQPVPYFAFIAASSAAKQVMVHVGLAGYFSMVQIFLESMFCSKGLDGVK